MWQPVREDLADPVADAGTVADLPRLDEATCARIAAILDRADEDIAARTVSVRGGPLMRVGCPVPD